MRNFLFSIFLLVSSACSTMEYNTSGSEAFYVSARPKSEKQIEIEKTKDFYFWGMSPENAEVNFQDTLIGLGVYTPSYVAIEQRYTIKDILLTFITLGLYCPTTYKLTLLTNGGVK